MWVPGLAQPHLAEPRPDMAHSQALARRHIKIISKGINIYPREIEELIYKFEGVDAVAVIGLKDETKDEEVIAFIQPKDDITLKENELRVYLKTHLANFKLPKQIYFVEELPKNATGKVLKRVLKEKKIANGGFIRKHPN